MRKLKDKKCPMNKLLTSPALTSYLRSLLFSPCSDAGIKQPPVKRIDPKGRQADDVAYTDGDAIFYNPLHDFFNMGKTKAKRISLIIGAIVHEFGHIRFTDFALYGLTRTKLAQNGEFYPPLPDGLPDELEDNIQDINNTLKAHPDWVRAVIKTHHHIFNTVEDAYIEEALYHVIAGILLDSLNYLRYKQLSSAPTLREMLDKFSGEDADLYPIIDSMLLYYAKYGTMRYNRMDEAERDSMPVQWLKWVKPYVDAAVSQDSARKRMINTNLVFIALWPVCKAYVEKYHDLDDEDMEQSMNSHSGAMRSAPSGAGGTGQSGNSQPKNSPGSGPQSGAKAPLNAGDKKSDPSPASQARSKQGGLAPGTPSPAKSSGDDEDEGNQAGDQHIRDTSDGEVIAGSGDDVEDEEVEIEEPTIDEQAITNAISKMEHDALVEEATEEVAEDLYHDAEKELLEIDYGPAHKGIKKKLTRIKNIPDFIKEKYPSFASSCEKQAKIMAKKIAPELRKRKAESDMPLPGCFSGSRFDAKRLVNNDCRYFTQRSLPAPDLRVAVSILVDESGSMCYGSGQGNGESRADVARRTALTLHLFCKECDIKTAILGFYEDNGVSCIQCYTDYDSPSPDDKYRILDIQARNGCNRDGLALKFAGEHLLKRPEPNKLLFVISDGSPNGVGYTGQAANADVAHIAADLRRRGIVIFAAAIGDDKDAIHRIYGDRFLDITDLATLPDQLLTLVKRYIK